MATRDNERILYLDCLRVFSIFAMMVLHVSASHWAGVSVDSFAWACFHFYDSLVRFCVPIFVMISGVFFLDNDRPLPVSKLFTKSIPRIVVPFLLWSFCYSTYFAITQLLASGIIDFHEFLSRFVWGHYHLWFVFTLAALYLIAPLLRKITQDRATTEYFLMLSFLFGFCFNFLKILPQTAGLYTTWLTKTSLYFPLGYASYFVLGFYLHKYKLPKKAYPLLYCLGFISLLFTIVATAVVSLYGGVANQSLYSYLLPNTLFVAVAVFLLFQCHVPSHPTCVQRIGALSQLSFGMYLVHDFFNILFAQFGLTTLSYNPIFSVPINATLVFCLSLLAAFLLSKIPFLKKWMM